MKIIAISDWRVQDIEQFIDYLQTLKEKPDVILYAGDDLKRFNRLKYKYLSDDQKKDYRERFVQLHDLNKMDVKGLEEIIELLEIEHEERTNKYVKIAKHSKYGMCVIAGNDDLPIRKKSIEGRNVFDVHDKSLIVGDHIIIGIEGSTGTKGALLYTEKQVAAHLKNRMKLVKDKQIILLSHSPPYNILDFAIRHGKRNIGSTALRDFIDKYSNKIPLVISGHVHLQGEKVEKYKNTYVVNCASHDNSGAPGRIALINIEEDNIEVSWKSHFGLRCLPYISYKREKILQEHGISGIDELLTQRKNKELSNKLSFYDLSYDYAKAIKSERIIFKPGIKSIFNNLEKQNIYFFDAEYDPEQTKYGPYGIFLLGWMDKNRNVSQLFLDNPKDERTVLTKFSQWVEKENPLFIAYSSKSADVPHLRSSFTRFKLPFNHIEQAFFDLYTDLLYTQNKQKQKIFLPISGPRSGSFGLKNVSEFFGFESPSLEISDGIDAPRKYEEYLRERALKVKEKIKKDLIEYNEDDLKRTKFVYDTIKSKL